MDLGVIVLLVLVPLSLAALWLINTPYYRIRRRRNVATFTTFPCYLQSDKVKDQKPQLSFRRVLSDNSFSKFKHLVKPEQSNSDCLHPYSSDINGLLENPSVAYVERGIEVNADNCPEMREFYDWIDTRSKLKEVADALSKETLFAVDTEQHSLRSFLGFTALVQVSTAAKDYLIDAIALHDDMDVLAPVFANPKICKVFHGADNDILWLQRDFHIYVVNLFDTAKACEVLFKPQKSLAYLLETYCSVSADKSFQKEDWRQRPLSPEMISYARSDAHYLLYIASRLISELKNFTPENVCALENSSSFLKEACRRSNMICLLLYNKETESMLGEVAASSIISRHGSGQGNSSLSNDKQNLIRRISMWRELLARVHDESLRYVLSDQAVLLLSLKAPKTEEELNHVIAEANETGTSNNNKDSYAPSSVVCSHWTELLSLIHENNDDCESAFWMLLEQHLGPSGRCPISLHNYALLFTDKRKSKGKQSSSNCAKQKNRKESRELFVKKFSCKAPVYHNCRIFANDGRLLCFCDRRKLEWYVRRKLAKVVDEEPPAIMLLFEPKGRPEDEGNEFYIQSKKNLCVCCGEGRHYLRYRIVPSCYRIHFPEHLKTHRSHDIVLLCVDCHEVAHAAAERFKRDISSEFGIPLFLRKLVESGGCPATEEEDEADVSPLQLRTAAVALSRHGNRMPFERRVHLTKVGEDELRIAMAVTGSGRGRESAGKLKRSVLGHVPHGKEVVERIVKEEGDDGVVRFCQRWRKVFVEATDPRFLPSGWDIMHSGKREFGHFSVYKAPLP